MYKDILEKLSKDRYVDRSFMERLERNGFEINYDKYEYWNNQECVYVGTKKIWLVETYNTSNNGIGCCYRKRNDVVEEIKLINEVLEIK